MKLAFELDISKDLDAVDVKFSLTGAKKGGDVIGGFSVKGDVEKMGARIQRAAAMLQAYTPIIVDMLSNDEGLPGAWLGDPPADKTS